MADKSQNLQKALEAFRKRQAEIATSSASAARKVTNLLLLNNILLCPSKPRQQASCQAGSVICSSSLTRSQEHPSGETQTILIAESSYCFRVTEQTQPICDNLLVQPKKAAPKRDGKPKAGRGRGRGQAPSESPLTGKEAVRNSVTRSTVPLAKQIKVSWRHLALSNACQLHATPIASCQHS